jgi:glycosyltransferase involved in cell wall biosynthesis
MLEIAPEVEKWRSIVTGRRFLWLNVPPWDGVWTRQNHFTLRLAKLGAEILYVETPQSLAGSLRRGRWSSVLQKPQIRSVADDLDVMTLPPVMPGSVRSEFAAQVVSRQIAHAVNRELQRRGWTEYTVWNRNPLNALILPQLHPGPSRSVFDITDDYGAFVPEFRHLSDRREQNLLRMVDVGFVTSPLLIPSRRAYNEKLFPVPNGVDYELFSQVGGLEVNPDIAHLPHPVIGYVGLIADWLDFEILEALGKRWPGQVVMIGPAQASQEARIQSLSGIHRINFVQRQYLPSYIQGMDVCIIPFLINEVTKESNPLKIWEYLATGKPIVSTDLPALDPCRDLVSVAANSDDFVEKVAEVFASPIDMQCSDARREVAQQFSWDRLFDQMMQHLSPVIEGLKA